MSLYAVVVLATTHSSFDPVLFALLTFIFSGIALYLLAALVYVTLTQMRPPLVIHAIHDAVLEARQRQLPIIQRTRRAPRITGGTRVPVQSRGDGYVANIDLKTIQRAIGDRRDDLEIVLHVQIGSYVALHDEVAEIRAGSAIKTDDLSQAILQALKLGPVRDLQYDPEHGIIQIMNIGWTSISTSKQNPVPGTEAINALRDFLGRWVGEEADPPDLKKLPVVYRDDISSKPLYMLESLAVVATESMQHQNFALVLRAFAKMFDRLSPAQRSQVEEIIPRILSRLQYEVLTTELDEALSTLADALDTAGRGEKTAQVVWEARQQARSTIQGLADTEDSA